MSAMLLEHLEQATDSIRFALSDLRAANDLAKPIASLAILPLIAEAAALQQRIDAVFAAIESDQEE